MKAYTDIEQSKKLAEILPIESADLWWAERYTGTVKENGEYIVDKTPFYYRSLVPASATNYSQDAINDIPCWSLAVLLELITKVQQDGVFFNLTYDFILNKWTMNIEADNWKNDVGLYDNPVDTCYEMIINLHEQKLL